MAVHLISTNNRRLGSSLTPMVVRAGSAPHSGRLDSTPHSCRGSSLPDQWGRPSCRPCSGLSSRLWHRGRCF
ncbi:hypothetical protein BO78DRAFT_452646, partial [Aspergillus sclerotiicarbonarius CBS 121057]